MRDEDQGSHEERHESTPDHSGPLYARDEHHAGCLWDVPEKLDAETAAGGYEATIPRYHRRSDGTWRNAWRATPP